MKYLILLTAAIMLRAIGFAQGCTVNYVEPSFQLNRTDPNCNPTAGSLEVVNATDGVAPYTYRLIELNITNTTGLFTGLAAGMYSVELKDACGTIRTRQATLVPYQFDFVFTVSAVSGACRAAQITITPNPPSASYRYGIKFSGNSDTTWSNSPSFIANNMTKGAEIIVQDSCGNLHTKPWNAGQGMLPYIKELQYRLQCDKVDIFPFYFGFDSPSVCLYDFATKALIQCKNATGSYTGGSVTNFFNVPYGIKYYVIVQDACNRDSAYFPDMTSAGGSQLDPYNWDCTTFTMHVDGMKDTVCLYNLITNQLVSCKGQDTLSINPRTSLPWPSGAVWDSLPYGSYYAWIFDPCTDSTFKIDSTVHYPFGFSAKVGGHCSVTQSSVQASFDPGAKSPYNIKVKYPDGSLAVNYTTPNYNLYVLYNTWPQAGNLQVIASDACGHADTSYIYQPAIYPKRSVEIKGGCPGLYGPSGGGDIILKGNQAAYNTATATIIKRDGVDTTINKSYSSLNTVTDENEFYFTNLPTGTYIVESSIGCFSMKLYDTVTIVPYEYPLQIANKIYQCQNNPYTFKDSTSHGVLPFTYEVIDTKPLYSPLMLGPQASNFYTIPAGSNLDSISVKVVDVCGNSNTKTFPVEKLSDCSTLHITTTPDKAPLYNSVVKVYPNPSRNHFVVSISQKKKSNYLIEILNSVGIKFYEKRLFNVDKKDLLVNESFTPGIYIINVVDLQSGKASIYKQIMQ